MKQKDWTEVARLTLPVILIALLVNVSLRSYIDLSWYQSQSGSNIIGGTLFHVIAIAVFFGGTCILLNAFNGKGTIAQTFNVYSYALMLNYLVLALISVLIMLLLAFAPVITFFLAIMMIIASVWGIVSLVIGLKYVHQISTIKVVVALFFVPVIVGIVVASGGL